MKPDQLPDEVNWLALISEGNEHAFAQLFDFYKNRIYTTALGFLKIPAAAEEIVQDCFLKIWLRRKDLSHVINFEAYLFTIARNAVFDRLKKQAYEASGRRLLTEISNSLSDSDFLVRRHECEKMLQSAISELPERQQAIYLMASNEGLSHEEIALKLGISPQTSRSHLTRALRNIRNRVRDLLSIMLF